MFSPRSGSSHYTFRKPGCQPITIPKHEPIKKVYVEWFAILLKVRRIVMKTLEQYMALPYPLEIIPDSDEGGFVGSYPDLRRNDGGCRSERRGCEARMVDGSIGRGACYP